MSSKFCDNSLTFKIEWLADQV
jgi:hypothetical protein